MEDTNTFILEPHHVNDSCKIAWKLSPESEEISTTWADFALNTLVPLGGYDLVFEAFWSLYEKGVYGHDMVARVVEGETLVNPPEEI